MAQEKDQTEPRMVDCVKIGRRLPGLASPPRNDDLGKRIFENVSAQAWNLWLDQQTILINHYGLNMADPAAHAFLSEQLEEFFFGEGAKLPDDWIPEEERGQHPSPGGKGAPSSKGAPAPARK
jgi:Fe-S cluster biosynthesis and repair protein YggX